MKISMIPNKIVKLIHASKGDTSLRKWAFEPYDNNGAINVSNIKDQLVYKTENGGTEQLLPVNTSTPTTSYFDGTINYGTDTDVEFTYKQSSYTGQARIKSIKGNTLVWNQLVQNGNFASTSNWSSFGATNFSVSNNIASFDVLNTDDRIQQTITKTDGHKYLATFDILTTTATMRIYWNGIVVDINPSASWQRISAIYTSTESTARAFSLRLKTALSSSATVQIKNWNLFDLTLMFSSGNEPTIDQFKSLFPLNYYAYNSGSLLNFNGTGIKTTGKNFCPKFTSGSSSGLTYTAGDDGSVKVTGTNTGTAFYSVQFTLPAGKYVLSGAPSGGQLTIRKANGDGAPSSEFRGGLDDYGSGATFTVSAMASAWLNIRTTAGTHDQMYYPMIRFAGSDSVYEPYKENTAYLPVQTYFPTGMKSAGSGANTKYDEITGGKAITRIGTRAYASGDESDSTVTTDGANTNYELATYTEQDIKTASLVCKDIEVPCYLDNGNLVCDATEELTNESGFFDAKLKIKDSSSVAYSSKFKLHVEDL